MILVTGGVRSGKSRFAETLAGQSDHVLYVATAVPFDDEMQQRVQIHRQNRNTTWETYEGYKNLDKLIQTKSQSFSFIILECITTLLTNLLHDQLSGDYEQMITRKMELAILDEMQVLANAISKSFCEVIVITNEIGLGVVPESHISRHFRDLQGFTNQLFAKAAHTVYMVVSGIPIAIKQPSQEKL